VTDIQLDSLFVDEQAIDLGGLAAAISPFARIGRDSGAPLFTQEGRRLSDRARVYVTLLVRSAWAATRSGESEILDSRALMEQAEPQSADSLRKALERLVRERLVERRDQGWRARGVAIQDGTDYLARVAGRRRSPSPIKSRPSMKQ
jgi:hypothetical protein